MLVRHGATVLSAEDRFAGSSDVPLGDEGRMQAERLAQRLATDSIAAIYGSPLRRAQETAAILARPHEHDGDAPSTICARSITAAGKGCAAKMRQRCIPKSTPPGSTIPSASLRPEASRDSTSWSEGCERFSRSSRAHPGECVLVVSHKATIRLIIAHVLGIDPRGYRDRLDQLAGVPQHDRHVSGRHRAADPAQRRVALHLGAAPDAGDLHLITDRHGRRRRSGIGCSSHSPSPITTCFPSSRWGSRGSSCTGSGVRCERATSDARRRHDSGRRSSASPLPSVS